MLPDLIVIGAQKCGTTSLHHYLDLHPAISMSTPKELDFFVEEHNWGRGLDWYERRFEGEAAVHGESSPSYTNFPEYRGVPERMASVIPDAKLVYVVGDPLERIVSHYIHHYAVGGTRRSIGDELGVNGSAFLAHSLYHMQLERYRRVFPDESILVITKGDLLQRRLPTLQRVFRFVGVSDRFSSPGFERLHHPSSEKRVGDAPIRRPELDGELRRRLLDRLAPDVDRLRAYTGLALADWPL